MEKDRVTEGRRRVVKRETEEGIKGREQREDSGRGRMTRKTGDAFDRGRETPLHLLFFLLSLLFE